ncbi:MAG TPA: ABC transporter substrate-binding protein, partial [Actinopolymorphaceae bacterium]
MRTRRTRRALAAGLALSAIALPLAACGDSGERADGKTEITFSYLWTGQEDKAMQKIIADFNASQDEIVVKGVSNPDQQAQLASMSGAKGTFDISDSFGSTTGAFAAKGVIEPLDGFIEADGYDTDDFLEPAMKQSRYDGRTYAMPIAVHSLMLLYNKDLLDEAGVTEPPRTTSEWASAIAKTTKVEGKKIQQLGWANPDLTTLGYTFGGGWFDDKGRPTPDHPGNIEAAQFYVENVARKYGAPEVQKFTSGFGEYASPQNPFFQGKVAMVTDGEWMSAFIKEYAPDLNWGVAPIPYPDEKPELEKTTQLSSSTLFIPRNSRHKEEAWTFMKYLLDKKAMLRFTHTLANIPSRKSLLDDPTYEDLPNFDA